MYVAGCHLDAMRDARDVRFVSGVSQSLIASGMKWYYYLLGLWNVQYYRVQIWTMKTVDGMYGWSFILAE